MAMTTTEAAKELGTSRARVVAMIRDGRIKAERFGRDWSIRDDALTPSLHNRKPGRPRKTPTTAPTTTNKPPTTHKVAPTPTTHEPEHKPESKWHNIAQYPKRK